MIVWGFGVRELSAHRTIMKHANNLLDSLLCTFSLCPKMHSIDRNDKNELLLVIDLSRSQNSWAQATFIFLSAHESGNLYTQPDVATRLRITKPNWREIGTEERKELTTIGNIESIENKTKKKMRQFQRIKLWQHHFVLILIDRSSFEKLLK